MIYGVIIGFIALCWFLDGIVTFSQMNAVCAAGTGSFLEEQVTKLGCPLSAYWEQTVGVSSPLASDRCTVFWEDLI